MALSGPRGGSRLLAASLRLLFYKACHASLTDRFSGPWTTSPARCTKAPARVLGTESQVRSGVVLWCPARSRRDTLRGARRPRRGLLWRSRALPLHRRHPVGVGGLQSTRR